MDKIDTTGDVIVIPDSRVESVDREVQSEEAMGAEMEKTKVVLGVRDWRHVRISEDAFLHNQRVKWNGYEWRCEGLHGAGVILSRTELTHGGEE